VIDGDDKRGNEKKDNDNSPKCNAPMNQQKEASEVR
jgi:hypothetical protein